MSRLYGTAVLQGGPRTYHVAGADFKENVVTDITNPQVWEAVSGSPFFRCIPAPLKPVTVQPVPDSFDPKKRKVEAPQPPPPSPVTKAPVVEDDDDDDVPPVATNDDDDDDEVEVVKPKKDKKHKKHKKAKAAKSAEDDDDDD